MGIKRGVSLYSYQQEQFFRKMTWKDMLREVATNLDGADGIEIVTEATIPQYPFPPESFYYDWNNEMARWGLKAVTMDTYLDTLQFRNHVMTYEEAADHIKMDLRIAKKMGFENIRLVHNIPFEAIEPALPLAEELDVRITSEIHAPATIKPTFGVMFGWGTRAAEDVAFIQRTGTKHYGLQPDFGIFQHSPTKSHLESYFRGYMEDDKAHNVAEKVFVMIKQETREEIDKYVGNINPKILDDMFYGFFFQGASAAPEDLYSIAPYIFCIHGKFNTMTEIEGQPGVYEEPTIDYVKPIAALKGMGYNGYINSEFEGQRDKQDGAEDKLANEVEEVRRHHKMMKRLIEKPYLSDSGFSFPPMEIMDDE